jgi:hypothetical protein
MLRQTLVVLGIGVVVAGFASTTRAQSANPSSSGNNSVTLSGDSLRRVEGRTISDSQNFFSPTSPASRSSSETNIGTASQSPGGLRINRQQVDFVFGDTLNPQNNPTSFPSPGEQNDNERVKLQVPLSQ